MPVSFRGCRDNTQEGTGWFFWQGQLTHRLMFCRIRREVSKFVLRRGYDHLVTGKRVLVVDDIVNTGHSIRQTMVAVRQAKGEVIAAGALVTRGNVIASRLGVDNFIYLLEYKIPTWPADRCPLCKANVPVNTQYAHGADYLAAQMLSREAKGA
jgi:orotate phosphoribosyltransferase